jgi:hypothetical protein
MFTQTRKGKVMTAESAGEKKKGYFYCEVCRQKVEYADAKKAEYVHCGRKMTPLEEAYMDSPSPTGA